MASHPFFDHVHKVIYTHTPPNTTNLHENPCWLKKITFHRSVGGYLFVVPFVLHKTSRDDSIQHQPMHGRWTKSYIVGAWLDQEFWFDMIWNICAGRKKYIHIYRCLLIAVVLTSLCRLNRLIFISFEADFRFDLPSSQVHWNSQWQLPFLRVDCSFNYLGKRNMALSTALLPRNSYLTMKHGCTSLFLHTYMYVFKYIHLFVILHWTKIPDIYTSIIFTSNQPASFKKKLGCIGCIEVVAVAMLVKKWWIAWM